MYNKEYINLQTKEMLDLDKVKTLKDNAMLKVNPNRWVHWDFEKNDELGLDIWNMTFKSNKKVWWLCDKEHSYDSTICSNVKCPYCSNKKVLKGFNDMWTTKPELAKLLANAKDGYKYTYGSSAKVDWKCENCSSYIKAKPIHMVNRIGIKCSVCSTGKSFGERVVYAILNNSNVEFESENSYYWSQGKRYDFYIPYKDMIIEVHGSQHYKEANRGRTLKEEQENDKYKYELAIKNGIKHYIIINYEEKSFEKFKNNIESSGLLNILNIENIDWNLVHKESLTSQLINVCKSWSNGNYKVKDLSDMYKITVGTVTNYLKKGTELGICYYDSKNEKRKQYDSVKRKIIQIKDEKVIKIWDSVSEASKFYNVNSCNIIACCKRTTCSSANYQWLYEGDFLKGVKPKKENKKYTRVVQLTLNNEYIRTWNSIKEASCHLGYHNDKSSISRCCKGVKKDAFGYKWVYEKEYNIELE